MKKVLIILISIIIVAGAGYLYLKFSDSDTRSSWSFVPSDAVLVYESDNPYLHLQDSKEKKIWKNLSSVSGIQKIYDYLDDIDSATEKSGAMQKFFKGNEVLLSFHVVSQKSVDVLMIMEVGNLDDHEFLSRILDHYHKGFSLQQSSRNYLGHTITELSSAETNFAYIFYKSYFIGSFTPYLVEDAIRVIEEDDVLSFRQEHEGIFNVNRLEKDQGNLYVNSRKLDQLAGIFTDPTKVDIARLSLLSELSFLDVSINEDNILLTGFSLNDPIKGNYLDSFDEVESSEFEMTEIIPSNTAAFLHISFDDVTKWHTGLKNFWRKSEPSLLTGLGEIENKYDILATDIYDFTGSEIGLIIFESINPRKPDMVTCMKISNRDLSDKFFRKLSEQSSKQEELYAETWSDVVLGHIEINELPARLFGPIFNGFPSSFYCHMGEYLLLGNNEQALKQQIDLMLAEETWRKSIKVNNFLDIANKEANFSLFVNTPAVWDQIISVMNDDWKQLFTEEAFTLKQIEYAAFQFSNVDGKYYTNIALQHPGQIIEKPEASEFNLISELEFSNDLITKPNPVRNHNDRSLEMIVQDSLNRIYLVSSDMDTLWKKQIDSEIKSPIYQIDYYKNGKLQYLFSTDSSIHIVDRIGENVPGYPLKQLNDQKIKFLSSIDYDNSRNYRIMASIGDGDYYLYDKSGKNLEGWQPRSLNGEPVMPPFHLRVRARDYMMFLHEDGLVHVLNRRGENVEGFPLDMKGKTENGLFIQKGGDTSTTIFTALTNEGEIVEFSLAGKFLKRKQLFKSASSDLFKLVISNNKRDFIIIRKSDDKLTIINSNGDELFDLPHSTEVLEAKYYHFGVGNEVVVITDVNRAFTYLYNKNGQVLHALPMETANEISMLYFGSQASYKIYCTFKNKLSVLELKR